jgi:hypothetical protein
MAELVVVLSTLVILALSIAGMNIYRRWNDVLTGPYISNGDYRRTFPDKRASSVDGMAKRKRRARSFGGGPSLDLVPWLILRTRYSSIWAIGRMRLDNALRSALLSVIRDLKNIPMYSKSGLKYSREAHEQRRLRKEWLSAGRVSRTKRY